MAKRNGSTSSLTQQDLRRYRQLGQLGAIVWALRPTQRGFLRDAMRVTATAAGSREIDRTVMLRMIDTAFDEIEAAVQVYERRTS